MYSRRPVSYLFVVTLLPALLTGCGLFTFLTHDPTEDLKDAATDLSSGMKGSAKELGAGLRESGEQYREDIRAASKDLSRLAQSASELAILTKDSPAAFSDAMTRRLLQDKDIQTALKSFADLARAGEHFAAAVEEGPALLAAQLTDLQGGLTKGNGFFTQQRIAILDQLRTERLAISETIRRERQDAMQDLDAFSIKMIQEASSQLGLLVAKVLWIVILLVVVLWGLPFGAGILVGRLMRKTTQHPAPPALPSHPSNRYAHSDQLEEARPMPAAGILQH